ncbi:hypothetical protein SAMN05216480_101481 [Pustulibacterium marinum]|uniref:Tetratricopeptide repeat-containing protein n=1 Tax=Pustulibacterium marinum TaxID=1224947 RepID=A0A1I7EZZ8_9FLAO|nr:hypothetical protein [Pustulibacterium marinum]SFU29464.1 hypothetical protein SAMN05216480_101481 [Pustulibacterium marinum]
MKKIILQLCLAVMPILGVAQTKGELVKHYEAFYNQMKKQGDLQGSINALTHLNVLEPNQANTDTLAYYYLSANQYVQALNVIGIEKDENASALAVQVKAVSLKSLNQREKALEQYEILFKKTPNIYIAYEMADLRTQLGNFQGAMTNIEYGLANVNEADRIAFYESNQPYEVPAKAAFMYQKALSEYSLNQTDLDTPINTLTKALAIAPKFTLAQTIKKALLQKKAGVE